MMSLRSFCFFIGDNGFCYGGPDISHVGWEPMPGEAFLGLMEGQSFAVSGVSDFSQVDSSVFVAAEMFHGEWAKRLRSKKTFI
jgi:hypothetical protein